MRDDEIRAYKPLGNYLRKNVPCVIETGDTSPDHITRALSLKKGRQQTNACHITTDRKTLAHTQTRQTNTAVGLTQVGTAPKQLGTNKHVCQRAIHSEKLN